MSHPHRYQALIAEVLREAIHTAGDLIPNGPGDQYIHGEWVCFLVTDTAGNRYRVRVEPVAPETEDEP